MYSCFIGVCVFIGVNISRIASPLGQPGVKSNGNNLKAFFVKLAIHLYGNVLTVKYTCQPSLKSQTYITSGVFPVCWESTIKLMRVSGLLESLSMASCSADSASSYLLCPINVTAWPFNNKGVDPYLSTSSWNM